MLRALSMSAADLYRRHAERVALQAAAERDASIRASKCGRACDDLSGFESVLDEMMQEKIG